MSKAKDGMLFSSGISLSTFQLLVKRGFQKVKDGMLFSGGISPNVTLKQHLFEQFRVLRNHFADS